LKAAPLQYLRPGRAELSGDEVTAAAGAEAEVVWIKHPENMPLIFISIGFVQMLMKKRKAKSEKRKLKKSENKGVFNS
jgi:hypothetical protein